MTKSEILSLLERLGVIENTDERINLRELRNNLAHEYSMFEGESISNLNYLYEQLPVLKRIFITLEQQISK
jgi:hypothetical protein